jgi:hypothetical protein
MVSNLELCLALSVIWEVRKDADKSLAFPVSYFPICSTTKIIFLGWVKEVRTTNS